MGPNPNLIDSGVVNFLPQQPHLPTWCISTGISNIFFTNLFNTHAIKFIKNVKSYFNFLLNLFIH